METDRWRLVVGLVLVFVLGVMFAIVNGAYTSSTNMQLPLIVYLISFLSIIVGAVVVLLFQWRLSRVQLERVLRVLPADERVVVKILLDNKGSIEQNRLVAFSGMSKVQVSRLLQKLSLREVVEKKNLGNTNLVVLKL
ncbi:hypothetical protein HY486_04715 [Candidatus Woesearchaeota archaeon]|nr:hypothetical protein [Candidatus Woesearchaeota archaeon]